ncbi:hypothetical protein [Nocardia brasiliensis]|uniref:hypothetical protein n=1 Tax=Nocardia brasiliensis TaxID=37326 RepID=UPI00245583E3|nr:hypothetical protein [Nocardia brasiliensis]
MSPQKSRASQPLEPPPVRPATEPAGGTTGTQDLAARLANALKCEGDRESAFQFRERTFWLPVAKRLLGNTELLDAIVAWRLRSNAIGVIVGEVVIPPDGGWEFDESGEPMFDRISQTLHTSESAAREELAEVRETDPEARLFALTDITEEPTS